MTTFAVSRLTERREDRRYNRPGMRSKQRRFPFVQLDVFSSVALEGNPLAVFPDGRGLGDEKMQAVAREVNLSGKNFVFPNDPAVEVEGGGRGGVFTGQGKSAFSGATEL